MLRKFRLMSVAAVALAASVAVTAVTRAADDKALEIGTVAPTFKLQDQTGKEVNLADYAGKVVVLEWTNPECPYVQAAYDKKHVMTKLADDYKDKGVVWLAVNSTGSATNEKDAAWVAKEHISYPVLNDSAGTVGHAYGAKTTPDMFVIDKAGKLVYSGAIDNDKEDDKGSTATNYVKDALDSVLADKPVAVTHTESYGCGVHFAH